MKKNNKGFSLVELIVAFAIAAIAGVSVYSMMSVSGNMFRKTSNDIGLQYEQQVVVNQIRDYVLESSNAVYYDESSKALYVFNQNRKTQSGAVVNEYDISKLTYVAAGDVNPETGVEQEIGKLYSNSKVFNFDTFPEPDEYMEDADLKLLGDEFGTNIKDLTYDLSDIKNNKLTFDITFEENGREFKSEQVVMLRNMVIESDELNRVFDTVTQNQVNSYIQYIGIKRADGTDEYTGGTDPKIIGLVANSSVKIKYKAIVHTKLASERKYLVDWQIEGTSENESGEESEPFAISNSIAELEYDADNPNTVTVVVKKIPSEDTYTYLYLKAISRDEPEKYCRLKLQVDGNGNYPKSAELKFDEETNIQRENGYSVYAFVPKIEYETVYGDTGTNIVNGTDALPLIKWKVEIFDGANKIDLPVGKESGIKTAIDANTGKLTLTEEVNGKRVCVSFRCNQLNKDAEEVWSNVVEFTPTDIKPFNTGLKFGISCNSHADRNSWVIPSVTWAGSETLKTRVKYFWKIVPYNDADSAEWNKKTNSKFDKMISVRTGTSEWDKNSTQKVNGDISGINSGLSNVVSSDLTGWYTTDFFDRSIRIDIKHELDWMNEYKIKLLVFAVTTNEQTVNWQKVYNVTNESKVYDLMGEHPLGQDIVPVEYIITIPKVKMTIAQVDGIPRFDGTWKFKPASDNTFYSTTDNHPDDRAFLVSWYGVIGGDTNTSSYYTSALEFTDVEGGHDTVTKKNCEIRRETFDQNNLRYAFSMDPRKIIDGKTTIYDVWKPYKVKFSLKFTEKMYVDSIECPIDIESNAIGFEIAYEKEENK